MAPLADDEEMTELLDADFPRVDLVGKGANGIPRFLIAKQDEASRGLVPPDLVRELIGKQADPELDRRERVEMPSGVTLSGSPADIAAFIHKAAVRQAAGQPQVVNVSVSGSVADGEGIAKAVEYEQVIKAKYDAADRKKMAGNGQAMKDGSYPIGDKDDLGKAIRAVGRGGSEHDAIRRHVIARAKALGASSEIPDSWASDGSLKEKVSKDMADMGPDLDDGVDGMDPTVALAEPDEMAPGDMTDPGSPAWESIDAATAQKWTSIAVRLKNALCVLAEREMLEAASADPDDCENAFDLQDAMCAVDYVIDTLAGFAVDEQAEADLGGEAMEAVGKSAADAETLTAIRKAMDGADLTATALTQLETFGAVIAKSGRVLSSVNEAHIREAAGRLNTVLQSLPQAPTTDDGQPVAKSNEETTVAETQTEDAAVAKDGMPASPEMQAKSTGPVNAGGTTGMGEPRATGPDGALPFDGPQSALPGDAQTPGRKVIKSRSVVDVYDSARRHVGIADEAAVVQKADGDEKKAMQAVFDQDGDLIGIVDPDAIQPVTGAGGPSPSDMDGDGTEAAPAADAATDMTPAPAADAGTPADMPADDNVTKQDPDFAQTVAKSVTDAITAALTAQGASHEETVAKQAKVIEELTGQVEVLKGRIEEVASQPAMPKVFTNGQVPPQHMLRGQDQGTAPGQVDVAKALDLKHQMYTANPAEAKAIHDDLNQMARDQLAAIHRR